MALVLMCILQLNEAKHLRPRLRPKPEQVEAKAILKEAKQNIIFCSENVW